MKTFVDVCSNIFNQHLFHFKAGTYGGCKKSFSGFYFLWFAFLCVEIGRREEGDIAIMKDLYFWEEQDWKTGLNIEVQSNLSFGRVFNDFQF